MSTNTETRFLPYGRQCISDEEIDAVVRVLRSDWLTTGPTVELFEAALADYCGTRHAVAVSSGTAALHLAALAAGIGSGDRVLTTPNTFLATANCVLYAGGRPGFVDIDPATLNIDPQLLERRLEEDGPVRCVIPVHFAGYPVEMARIAELAQRHGFALIEDASHAIGAAWRDDSGGWHRVGACSHSDMTTVSFHPVKHLTTGEGGAVLTNRDDLAERVRELRNHGSVRDPRRMTRSGEPWYYEMQELGFNYRLSDLHCALGLAQLGRVDGWLARRAELVARYHEGLGAVADVKLIRETDSVRPAWHLFTVQVPRRAAVYSRLRERGIGAQVHYIPVHLHPYYRQLLGTGEGDFPHTEAYYDGALSLPLYPALDESDVDRVVAELIRAVEETA